MEKQNIIDILKDYNPQDVEKFAAYCIRLKLEKDKKTWKAKNYWMQQKTAENMAELFKRVDNEWLVFDGTHITIQSTWVSYDYVALKNRMYIAYPETVMDVQVVYKWDDFSFQKVNWEIFYDHKIASPFDKKDENIIWAYCIIKNKRWEFINVLSAADIAKHRKSAKTDYIWKAWFEEMVLKTIIKKGCKIHFSDIYSDIIEEDNNENSITILYINTSIIIL